MDIFVKIKIEKNLDSIYSILSCLYLQYCIKNNKIMIKKIKGYKIDLAYKVKYITRESQ